MTDDRLTPVVDAILTDGAATTAPAGAAVAIRTAGTERTAVAGSRTGGLDAPMTVDTEHDLASVTKVVATTTVLIRLISQRALRLDDAVTRHLPWFRGEGRDRVTVRHLLAHRAGLWEWQPLYLTGIDPWEYLSRLPLRYRPESGYHYSDLGFMLLGRIIETVTGMRLDEAVHRLVTEPLGLRFSYGRPGGAVVAASSYGDTAERRMVATGEPYPILGPVTCHRWRDEPIAGEVNDGNAHKAFHGVSGHAGLFGTLGDLLRFGHVLAHYRDHTQLWRPEVVDGFLAPGPDSGRHLGFRSWTVRGATLYGHPGFVGCVIGFAPESGTALALCSNRLLTHGTPTPVDELWSTALTALPETVDRYGYEESR